jgi:sulfur-oxidizing protein SoxX
MRLTIEPKITNCKMWNEFVMDSYPSSDKSCKAPVRREQMTRGGTMRQTRSLTGRLTASPTASRIAIAAGLAALLAAAAPARAQEIHDHNLLPYTIKDYAIDKPLTGKPGDAAQGRKWATTSGQGNCVICHRLPIPEVAFRIGNVGPDLSQVGARLSPAEIRMRIVNPKVVNPDTIMPAYYRIDGLNRVQKKFAGKSMLTAEQVEDLVAYLSSLK